VIPVSLFIFLCYNPSIANVLLRLRETSAGKQKIMLEGGAPMKKIVFSAALFIFIAGFTTGAHAELESFLSKLNAQAKADLSSFSAKLSSQFGLPVPQIRDIIKSVEAPADAFMCLQLGQMAQMRPEAVVQTYRANKGKGWGAIAKELGIKPGSPEFHALKRGDFSFTGEPGGSAGQGPGKGKGKGRGHDR
jgi:hypothetical protein